MTPFAIGLGIGAIGLAADEVRRRRLGDRAAGGGGNRWISITVAGVALVTAVAATAQTVAAGHSGAEATWQAVGADV